MKWPKSVVAFELFRPDHQDLVQVVPRIVLARVLQIAVPVLAYKNHLGIDRTQGSGASPCLRRVAQSQRTNNLL